jgi:predicted ArsR family transcriptional regulator
VGREFVAPTDRDERFFASTRGRIVLLLRRAARTVDELARPLGLTDNGIRAHLLSLERDGLVRQAGARRGERKPASLYELSPSAERLFPRAYGQVLRELLEVLGTNLSGETLARVLRQTGRRLATEYATADGTIDERVTAAANVLEQLGGVVEIERTDAAFVLRGRSCPLAVVVPGHPEACQLAESLLSELIGSPVHERCNRSGDPLCCFEVPLPPATQPARRGVHA